MKNTYKLQVIDMHNHAINSQIADRDKDLSIGYDELFALYQKQAEASNRDMVVSITEHDNFSMTKEEYYKYSEKYPNVKIVLGMEVNADLTSATDGVFKRAHMLVYADMSSEESINKWFASKELFYISKIKTHSRIRVQKKLYIAKSILNKKLGLGITNKELATLLIETEKLDPNIVYGKFVDSVLNKIRNVNPALYSVVEKEYAKGKEFKDLDLFDYYSKASDRHYKSVGELLFGSKEFYAEVEEKVPLEDVDKIVKQTGGYLMIAHPQNMFEMHKDQKIPNRIKHKIAYDVSAKMYYLREICEQKGIKLSGFEITPSLVKTPANLRNALVFAEQNGFEVSFGTDKHFEKSVYINEKNSIPQTEYKKVYFNQNLLQYNGREINFEVNGTSLINKIFGIESDVKFSLRVDDKLYVYGKEELKDAHYSKEDPEYFPIV